MNNEKCRAAAEFAWFAMVASTLGTIWVGVILFGGQPPQHCRYLVPVKTVPGIYACSEHPRPLVKP